MFHGRGGCFERGADTPNMKLMEGQQAKQNLKGNLQKRRHEYKLSNTFISVYWTRKILSQVFWICQNSDITPIYNQTCNTYCVTVTSSWCIDVANPVFLAVCPSLKIAAATSSVIGLCTFTRIFKTISYFSSVSLYLAWILIPICCRLNLYMPQSR